MADDLEAKRATAAYSRTIAFLTTTQPGLSDEAMDAQALAAVDASVYGADAKRDSKGNFIPQGIGSKGHESANHFAAIRKYEGKEAYDKAVGEIWRRDPDHAKRLGLPQPART